MKIILHVDVLEPAHLIPSNKLGTPWKRSGIAVEETLQHPTLSLGYSVRLNDELARPIATDCYTCALYYLFGCS